LYGGPEGSNANKKENANKKKKTQIKKKKMQIKKENATKKKKTSIMLDTSWEAQWPHG